MAEADDDDLVPERNWRDRAYPISMIPSEIRRVYYEIKAKYGTNIANLVYVAYMSWGAAVARAVAAKILSFQSADDVLRFLQARSEMFNEESKRALASMIFLMKYDDGFEELIKMAKDVEEVCHGAADASLKVYHELAKKGYFFSPECVVNYVMVAMNCTSTIKRTCAQAVEEIKMLVPNLQGV